MEGILSHNEFKEASQNIINKMMKVDSVLEDLHPQINTEEVKALIQLEHGQAFIIYIERDSGSPWKLIVPREATVRDLKLALKTKVRMKLAQANIERKISWRYVWKTYWITFQGTKLKVDNKKLLDYGIVNKAKLNFIKKIGDEIKMR